MSEAISKQIHVQIRDSRRLLSHSNTISTGFHSQKLWGLPIPALEHWAGESCARLVLLTLQGDLCSLGNSLVS